MPSAVSSSTWSFIKAISGETTSVSPSRAIGRQLIAEALAAAGRHDAQAILLASTAEITSRCPGRNDASPKRS